MYLPFFEPTDGGKDPPEPPPKKAEILSRGTPGSGFFCGRMYEKAENSPFSNGFRYFGAKYRIKLRKITLMLLKRRRGFLLAQSGFQRKNSHSNLVNHFFKFLVAFSRRVIQSPVVVKRSANEWAPHVAAHGDSDVRFGNIRDQLGILPPLHVDAIKLLHQPDGILIDFRLGFRPCGIAFKHIGRQCFAQSLRNLAAAGIMDANKRNLWLCHIGNLPFVLFAILTRNSMTGTAISTMCMG